MELIVATIGMILIAVLIFALLSFGRRLADMREIMLQSEDSVNRIAEKFEMVDDIQLEHQRRDDDRKRGRWN